MSRNVSLLDLRTWALQLSDTEIDRNITVAEVNALANRHIPEVFDRLVDAGPADYYAATAQITTTSGIIEYPVEVDFRNLLYVYVRETTDERRPLPQMKSGARGNYKAPSGVWTLDVEYIPTQPLLEDDADTFDGVSGFDELVANCMARDIMIKQQRDPSMVMSNIARLEARITARGRTRDKGGGKSVTDVDDIYLRQQWPFGWMETSKLTAYRLRGDNIELFEALSWWP